MKFDFAPSLSEYYNIVFNFAVRDLIQSYFEKNAEKSVEVNDFYYEIKFDKNSKILKLKDFENELTKNLKGKQRALINNISENNGWFYTAKSDSIFSLIEKFSKDLNIDEDYVYNTYQQSIIELDCEEKEYAEDELNSLLTKLKDFSIHYQNNNKALNVFKKYSDGKYQLSWYGDYLLIHLNHTCELFAIDFYKNGYEVYGQESDYGFTKEEMFLKEVAENHEQSMEELYIKHLNKRFMIVKSDVVDTEILNSMALPFHDTIRFICEEENLIKKECPNMDDIVIETRS